jgi:hypothetical protein
MSPPPRPGRRRQSPTAGPSRRRQRSYWIPGAYAPPLSEKRASSLRPLQKKGFPKKSVTQVGVDDLGTSTTLESNKSHGRYSLVGSRLCNRSPNCASVHLPHHQAPRAWVIRKGICAPRPAADNQYRLCGTDHSQPVSAGSSNWTSACYTVHMRRWRAPAAAAMPSL